MFERTLDSNVTWTQMNRPKKQKNMKDRKGPDEENQGVGVHCIAAGYLLHRIGNN